MKGEVEAREKKLSTRRVSDRADQPRFCLLPGQRETTKMAETFGKPHTVY